jgi:hypothetical protein
MAALHWYYARYKGEHPEFVRAPHYFDAILKWFESLDIDGAELVGTVHEVYNRPGWGEKVALQYANDLPSVPPWPFK